MDEQDENMSVLNFTDKERVLWIKNKFLSYSRFLAAASFLFSKSRKLASSSGAGAHNVLRCFSFRRTCYNSLSELLTML
jgi:hypothetical protein